jgi:hypothetical protein
MKMRTTKITESVIKQLDEIQELSAIPLYREGLLARHQELLRIYHEEIDVFLKEKYFSTYKKSDEFKFFRLQAQPHSDDQNTVIWDISIDGCDNPAEIFTPQLINYISSHEVNPHLSVEDQKFYNQKYEISFSFVRYTPEKIVGQVDWKPLSVDSSNIIRVVPNFSWNSLSDDAKAQIFFDQFSSNKDVRNAILLYFANYVYPYTTAIAV